MLPCRGLKRVKRGVGAGDEVAANRARPSSGDLDLADALVEVVDPGALAHFADIVDRQLEVGLDVVDDGEMGKGSWIHYLYERVGGIEIRPKKVEGSILPPSRDRQAFPGAYAALDALDEAATRGSMGTREETDPEAPTAVEWVVTGPMTYDRVRVDKDIANFKTALAGKDVTEVFMPVVAPASTYWLRNEYYGSGTRSSCLRSRTRCTRSTARSSRPASRCRSTTPCSFMSATR